MENSSKALRTGPLVTASTLLGLGMGGFIDGILLHQILQWHQMISNVIPPVDLMTKNINMFWDGIFHVFTWMFTLIGIILLWRLFFRPEVVKSTIILTGGLIFGWGLFNLADSIANHYVFKLHNVRETVQNIWAWNLGFLIFAILLIIIGLTIIQKGRKKFLIEVK